MKSNPFDKKLEEGDDFENHVIDYLQSNGVTSAVKIPGYFPDYDIFIAKTETKIECKNDKRADETGNLFIETSCNGKESGIFKTKAHYWFIRYDGKGRLYEKEKIIQCIKDNNFPNIATKVKQDFNNYSTMYAYIIPIKTIENYRTNPKVLIS